jgi:hypothetical protein
MDALIKLLTETSLSRFLIVAGILFLLLSVLGKLGAKIVVDPRKQKYAGIIGAILLFAGVVLNFISVSGPRPDDKLSNRPVSIPKVETNDITFSLQDCRISGGNVTCELLIISKIDIAPGEFIIHIRGDCVSKIVDYSGNEYFASLVKLGDKTHNRSVEAGLYANIPKKASLYFENISLREEKIAVLHLECFLLPGDRITATFHDVPLSE